MPGQTHGGVFRRRIAAGAVLVALAAALVACTPDEGPPEPPTAPETTTTADVETTAGEDPTEGGTEVSEPATATAGPTPPDLEIPPPPPEMSADDRAGAAATVEYFFALTDYAQATGDTQSLRAVSGPDCEACSNAISDVGSLHEAGGWVDIVPAAVSDLEVAYPTDEDPNYYVTFSLSSPGGVRHEGDGSTTELQQLETPDGEALVGWNGDGFVVNLLTIAAGG